MIAERLALRARKLTAIGDFALQFARTNAQALLVPALLCAVPAAALAICLSDNEAFWVWCLLGATLRVTSAPLTLACADLAVRPATALGPNLRVCVARMPVLIGVGVADAALRCVTLGLSSALFLFAPEVTLLERGGVGATVARSRKLLGAVPLRTIAMLALALLVPAWGALAGELACNALLELWSIPWRAHGLENLGISGPALAGAAFAEAGWTIVRFLVYLDCRTRAEGWDLQLQCQALVERHQAEKNRRAA